MRLVLSPHAAAGQQTQLAAGEGAGVRTSAGAVWFEARERLADVGRHRLPTTAGKRERETYCEKAEHVT